MNKPDLGFNRVPNGADYQRVAKLLKEKERELSTLKEKYDRELQNAIEITELQVRQDIIQEIQRRKQDGENEDSQIWSLIDSMKTQYALMEEELVNQNQSRLDEYKLQIQDLLKQIADVEDENHFLSRKIALLTGK